MDHSQKVKNEDVSIESEPRIVCEDPIFKGKFKALLKKYKHLFTKSWRGNKVMKGVVHHIDTGDENPFKRMPYRIAPKHQKCVDAEIEDMLEAGIIEESHVSSKY
ncbi:hypothetical protein B4U79_18781 [Dinothrombium tinctorium]|uniref:Uncharacterized protein n=1 Tax=Dinothrombium tinctorium TaxID=1965070 RepID=A0A443Q8V0_9ACAR|nr:hypothetical protein B4U79_18781 [Dinothrombium tinctorium]